MRRARARLAGDVAAALSRLLPHPANVTPVTALALFGAVYFDRKFLAFLVPLAAFLTLLLRCAGQEDVVIVAERISMNHAAVNVVSTGQSNSTTMY